MNNTPAGIDVAIALLKEQEPQETRFVRPYSRPGCLHCEKCGLMIDDMYRPEYCPRCRRKVNWNAD